MIMNSIGDEHPAEIGQGFDPRRDVDAVAINVSEICQPRGSSGMAAPDRVGWAQARGIIGGCSANPSQKAVTHAAAGSTDAV